MSNLNSGSSAKFVAPSWRTRLFFVVAALSLAIPNQVSARVKLQNGNFYISFTDVADGKLKIVRTYNSLATFRSMFGPGWGSDFETRLVFSKEGNLILHLNGSGSKLIFRVAAASGNSRRYVAGTFARATYDGNNYVVSYKKWKSDNIFTFNRFGKLMAVRDLKINVTYTIKRRAGNISSITSSRGERLDFEFYSTGVVKSIKSPKNKEAAFYFYNDRSELIYARDNAGNGFGHQYDNNYNMTAVLYKDGTVLRMRYSDGDKYIAMLRQRDGSARHYRYGSRNNDHHWTIVWRVSKTGRKSRPMAYEWLYASGGGYVLRTWSMTRKTHFERSYGPDGRIQKSGRRPGSMPTYIRSMIGQ